VVETAVLGEADALVTRDDDLKKRGWEAIRYLTAGGISVLSVRRFLTALRAGDEGAVRSAPGG
jgi:predicted nucleic acid-binding protein